MILFDADGLSANFHKRLEDFIPWEDFSGLTKEDQSHLLREVYRINPNFFYELEPNLQFFDLIEWAERSGEQWGILTAIGDDHHDDELVKEHKYLWHEKHFNIPRDKITIVPNSEAKAKFAEVGYILVDDYGKNCEDFISNGGMAIKVKANTYNSSDVIDTLSDLIIVKYTEEVCRANL